MHLVAGFPSIRRQLCKTIYHRLLCLTNGVRSSKIIQFNGGHCSRHFWVQPTHRCCDRLRQSHSVWDRFKQWRNCMESCPGSRMGGCSWGQDSTSEVIRNTDSQRWWRSRGRSRHTTTRRVDHQQLRSKKSYIVLTSSWLSYLGRQHS